MCYVESPGKECLDIWNYLRPNELVSPETVPVLRLKCLLYAVSGFKDDFIVKPPGFVAEVNDRNKGSVSGSKILFSTKEIDSINKEFWTIQMNRRNFVHESKADD